MSKINRKEYDILKEINDEWEWIARDKDEWLWVYHSRPNKLEKVWQAGVHAELNKNLFQFIKWEDEEPYSIAELIEEYEKDYKGSWEHAIEFSKEMRRESEETEVKKYIEWLKEILAKKKASIRGEIGDYYEGQNVALEYALDLIDQLDEPEVLSPDWIKDNQLMWTSARGVDYYVPADKLYGLLVPKQDEPEKVVVPEFVGEWIEECKRGLKSIYGALKGPGGDGKLEEWLFISPNQKTLARAWLDGYEVEKEKKYRVKDKNVFMLFKLDGKVVPTAEHFIVSTTSNIENDLTEQEIKDYDERYWPFAVPVEEGANE